MGVTTTTTVTCDECGKDITEDTQVFLSASQQIQNFVPPPTGEALPEGVPAPPPMISIPTMDSASVVLCDEHGKGAWVKTQKLIAKTATTQPK